MKQLTIEEKARRYDEAIERAQEAVDDGMISQNFVDDIFPELAESEDERMKKKFLELMKCPESYAASGITTEEAIEMIAWLEKVHLQHEWKQENTDNLTDFENAMMHIGGSFFGENAGLDPNDTDTVKEQANLLLELVPKQEWSEKDEKMVRSLMSICDEWAIRHSYFPKENNNIEKIKNVINSFRF